MKKHFSIVLLLCFAACSDGDLQIETLDFDSVAIQNCDNLDITTDILFKINEDEVLILDLAPDLLRNEVSTETIESTISTSQSQLIFRAFNDNVTFNYFCDAFPPADPIVIEEIEASGGTILITTTTLDDITFTHNIQFRDVILINALGEQIIDLRINDFGEIQTTIN